MPKIPSFALIRVEKDVLYRKYVSIGFSPEEAKRNIAEFKGKLGKIREKLKKKKKSEEDINREFKRKFEELCQELESKRIDQREVKNGK